jgi:hypothetical protein
MTGRMHEHERLQDMSMFGGAKGVMMMMMMMDGTDFCIEEGRRGMITLPTRVCNVICNAIDHHVLLRSISVVEVRT